MNIETAKLYVSARVTATLTGVPVLKVTNTRDILPEHVTLSYVYATVEEQTVWVCRSARVRGAPRPEARAGRVTASGPGSPFRRAVQLASPRPGRPQVQP